MRKFLLITVFVCAASLAASCATLSGVKEKVPPAEELFGDWEYKGFGRELPAWVEPYFRGGIAAVQAACPQYAGKEILIVAASGKNADQAGQALAEKVREGTVSEGFVPEESIWVCLQRTEDISAYGGDTYVSLGLYIK